MNRVLPVARRHATQSPEPSKQPDPDQAWFWSPAWQEKERQADEDIAHNRFHRFDSNEDFLASLEREVEAETQADE
jgi:hypothetical protein